ncbi:hypothetical protein NLO83_16285 [Pseudomonas tremae]|uniref:hypothetical protein n=1 Tax=Pseudomonas syringae group TaxID=136849 RepID=UPI001F45996F|nr:MULTISPECIES: hypothetical protein [Pseudomonas syringae group]MCQ3017140.1 hypothetical protein [Pseudomonas tremae]
MWQHSEACQQRVNADGNWLRQTDGKIQEKAIEREVEVLNNTESFQIHIKTVDHYSPGSVGGSRRSRRWARSNCYGEGASLAAVDDLHRLPVGI